jgi:hypothetical protein
MTERKMLGLGVGILLSDVRIAPTISNSYEGQWLIARGTLSGNNRLFIFNWDDAMNTLPSRTQPISGFTLYGCIPVATCMHTKMACSSGRSLQALHFIIHNASIRIGAACSGGCGSNLKFTGSIDDVRFYNRALTASEVKQLYLMGK